MRQRRRVKATSRSAAGILYLKQIENGQSYKNQTAPLYLGKLCLMATL
jgi:hypothetical protein